MLPEYIDQTEAHRFTHNNSRGFHVGFFRFDPDGSDRPVAGHWIRECGDERSLAAMLRWLSVRRANWQDWGRVAEALGRDAFALHMERLMEDEPIEEVVGTSVSKLDDPCEVAFGQMLAGKDGPRGEVLYVHRFSSSQGRHRFFDWLATGSNAQQSDALLSLALCSGTAALAQHLEVLAGSPGGSATNRKEDEDA